MKYFLVGYKGKHFVIQDKEDYLSLTYGTITDKELTEDYLKAHVSNCIYYGIPAYIGSNNILNKRIDNLYKLIHLLEVRQRKIEELKNYD